MTLRVSEVYASVQGEGPRTGQTTVFTRFGGCNLRCPGWPCDTQHAIDPAFRSDWERLDPDQLFERIHSAASLAGARLVTLTGGEPFLQPSADLERLVGNLRDAGYTVEAFTNGTVAYPDWAVETVSMIVDWKLPGSGEFKNIRNNVIRLQNLQKLDESSIWHAIKFVCKDISDFDKAKELYKAHPEWHDSFLWYYGKVWDGVITDAKLIEHVMKCRLPWRLNVQVHNIIWDPQERGR